MGVYSYDRLGNTDDLGVIVADESYDFATACERIMYENAQTDMAIFNAIIMNDMSTVVGVKEGTILESEVEAITEGSVKDFFQKIIDFIKNFASKLFGMIKSAIDKIKRYVVSKECQMYIKAHRKSILDKNYAGFEVEVAPRTQTQIDIKAALDEYETYVTNVYDVFFGRTTGDSTDPDDAIEKIEGNIEGLMLAKSFGSSDTSMRLGDYAEKVQKATYGEKTKMAITITQLKTMMDTMDDTVTKLKKWEIDSHNDIAKMNKAVTDARKKVKEPDSDKKEAARAYKFANEVYKATVTASNCITAIWNAKFKDIMYSIKQDRAVLAKAHAFKGTATDKKEAQKEAAYLEFVFETAMDEADLAFETVG